jgi:hypothetical protein
LRLAEALDLARRYGRPLSIVIARPATLPGENVEAEALATGAEAAREAARSTDLIGWHEQGGILVLMPEAIERDVKSALFRWGSEIALRTRRKWLLTAVEDAGRFRSVDELLRAAAERLTRKQAA